MREITDVELLWVSLVNDPDAKHGSYHVDIAYIERRPKIHRTAINRPPMTRPIP